MPRYTKYLRGNPYYDPERVTPSFSSPKEIRAFTKQAEISNLRGLSRELKKSAADPVKLHVNDASMGRQKARSLLAAFGERDFADPEKQSAYRVLRAIENDAPEASASLKKHVKAYGARTDPGGSPQKVQTSGANKKLFNPTGKDYAVTTTGNLARTKARLSGYAKHHWLPGYHLASMVLPCIEMHERREVMFAKRKAGKGYRGKRRINPLRIPC